MSNPTLGVQAFLPFYRHVLPLETFAENLAPQLAATVAEEDREKVTAKLWQVALHVVEDHSYRTLIERFHHFRTERGLPLDPGSRTGIDAFRLALRHPDTCEAVLDAYPVLRRRLGKITENLRKAYARMFVAFRDDRAQLADIAGIGAQETIREVSLSNSDPHNGNQRVMFVTTTSGAQLAYKPRPLAGDAFAHALFEAAEPYMQHSLSGCVPASLSPGGHGWQTMLATNPMTSDVQAGRYFYRLGALICLFGALGATDLHDENLLACGEFPCVVDTETLLRAHFGAAMKDTLTDTLVEQMRLSPASTLLLPVNNPHSVIDVMLAGVGVLGEQKSSLKNPTVVDPESDGIRVEWRTFTHRHSANVPSLKGEQLAIGDYFVDVMSGYRDALECVRPGTIDAVLDRFADMPVRCLIRATEVYARYLDASTHPTYLRDESESHRLFGLLRRFHRTLTPEQNDALAAAEHAALDTGDIPYFSTLAGDTDVCAYGGEPWPLFHRSPLATARRGLAMARERHDRFHRFLVEECLGHIAPDAGGVWRHSVFGPTLVPAGPGTWGGRIAEVIGDLAVTSGNEPEHGAGAGWIGSIGPDRHTPTINPGNHVAFHDMGGIRRALVSAGRHSTAHAAEVGLRELTDTYGEQLDALPESVFSGFASQLLSMPDAIDDAWLDTLLEKIAKRGEDREGDLSNGPAGPLMLLLSRMESGVPVRATALDALARTAFDPHGPQPKGARWEVAHGQLGVMWAKARAGQLMSHGQWRREAAEWLERQLPDCRPTLTGWCNGAAGVLLAAGEIGRRTGLDDLVRAHAERLVQAAVALPDDRPVDLSVRHGTSGVVQCLLAASRHLDDPTLIDRARSYQHRVLAQARQTGFYVGAPGHTSLVGYMLGWAGVADSDLMLNTPELPNGAPTAFLC
ncbi:type 2 lanthipeptide synthetase LanM [Streptomyces sp. 769]|uniref:type 2 lanthipeptide synthetase LanM n=1 Tax=Streptomyces sp. 769 TaxID=1262452 RepID=UPI00058201A2|nr:type 2 lanthipeptide synthetase LanM [Streptomyces sp. 769]AJC53114.1 cytolysin B transport protein [Streptomyces sp. 769]